METLVREHSFSPELIDRVYPMVDRITDLYGLDMEDWTKVRFKPEKAATLVMTRMNEMEVEDLHALGGLTAKTLCHGLLTAFYQAMREDDMAMARVEPEFRAALLDGLDRIIHSNEIEVQRQAMGLLSLPLRHWRADTFPPGALLRADTIQTAPFHGREQELTDIKSWCESEQTTAVRLYTGKGGMGKTRLFRRACEILHRKGWRSGFLNRMAGDAGDEHWQYLIDSPQSLFIVVVLAPRSTGNGFGVSAEQTPFSRRLAFFRIF
ncbi:MAG: hypothetical protein HQL07_16850, partial [Nitrospirae bacterium]|nr:hypothetical protein [Magnetococcales bacterium]